MADVNIHIDQLLIISWYIKIRWETWVCVVCSNCTYKSSYEKSKRISLCKTENEMLFDLVEYRWYSSASVRTIFSLRRWHATSGLWWVNWRQLCALQTHRHKGRDAMVNIKLYLSGPEGKLLILNWLYYLLSALLVKTQRLNWFIHFLDRKQWRNFLLRIR